MKTRLDYVDKFERLDKALSDNRLNVKDLLGAIPMTEEQYNQMKETLRLIREEWSIGLEERQRKLAKYWEQTE